MECTTPPAVVADLGAPLGHPRREHAPEALGGGPGHGPPALVLGLLRAAAPLAWLAREEKGGGQGAARDRPAQGVQDWRSTVPRRVAIAPPQP
jgi:hypothetical protein